MSPGTRKDGPNTCIWGTSFHRLVDRKIPNRAVVVHNKSSRQVSSSPSSTIATGFFPLLPFAHQLNRLNRRWLSTWVQTISWLSRPGLDKFLMAVVSLRCNEWCRRAKTRFLANRYTSPLSLLSPSCLVPECRVFWKPFHSFLSKGNRLGGCLDWKTLSCHSYITNKCRKKRVYPVGSNRRIANSTFKNVVFNLTPRG